MTLPTADGKLTHRSTPVHIESGGTNYLSTLTGQLFNTAIQFADSPSIDSFGRLRVSNPTGIWDSQLQYDLGRIWWEDSITDNSGNAEVVHDSDGASANITVGTSDEIIRQTRYYFRYQPGKSQRFLATFVMAAPATGLTQNVGYYDDDNGIFLSSDAGQISMVRRTSTSGSPVDNLVAQSNWNVDVFDGSGPSGITLDFTKSQILFIDLEWLGVGRVRTGFVIDGLIFMAHEFLNTNVLSEIYMSTANLPIRYEMLASAELTGTHTMNAICSELSSEGGLEFPSGITMAASNGTTFRAVTTRLPLLSIRPKATFNSIVNRGLIAPASFSVYTADVAVFLEIFYGATLTNPSFTSVNNDSIVEYDVSATAISGGIQFLSDYVPIGDKKDTGATFRDIASRYPLTLDITGSHPTSPFTDNLTICATSLGLSTDTGAMLSWKEIR